jgi:hypothetical protein
MTAIWAASSNRVVTGQMTYETGSTNKASGNTHIGFIAQGHPDRYCIGRIASILKVKAQRNNCEVLVFVVERFKPSPAGLNVNIWERFLAHQALGLHICSTETEVEREVVPFTQVIGHVAVNRLESTYGPILQTLQLTNVGQRTCPRCEDLLKFIRI